MTADIFFYGTLCHPQVLQRVTGGKAHIYIPAILSDHRRSRVYGADYPGVVGAIGDTVRGMLVQNLSQAEVKRLDLFEGDEYERREVHVNSIETGTKYTCHVYIYLDESKLEAQEWSFEDFEKNKLHFWTGEAGEQEYAMLADGTGGRRTFV